MDSVERATSVESTSGRPPGESATSLRVGPKEIDPPGELHVGDDRGPQRADGVRQRRAAVSRGDLLGDGCSADRRAPFEHERLETGPRQIERGDQAVVAGADDDRARHVRSAPYPSGSAWRRSFPARP